MGDPSVSAIVSVKVGLLNLSRCLGMLFFSSVDAKKPKSCEA